MSRDEALRLAFARAVWALGPYPGTSWTDPDTLCRLPVAPGGPDPHYRVTPLRVDWDCSWSAGLEVGELEAPAGEEWATSD